MNYAAFNSENYLTSLINPSDDEVITTTCCSPFDQNVTWTTEMNYGLRASSCKALNETSKKAYVLYGSVCWYLEGCKYYTVYGKCSVCFDGYYLNED